MGRNPPRPPRRRLQPREPGVATLGCVSRTPDPSSLPINRRTGAFERRVAAALSTAEVRGPVVVAVSGGPDSTAALVSVARVLGPADVLAAHFDHRLRTRSEARAEAAFVEGVAARLGVTVRMGQARRASDRSEAAAREARYRWLARVCREADAGWCATGHTLNDQAETVLLQLARGSGALGSAGMQLAGDWPVDDRRRVRPRLVRPLLGIARAEVESYLAALELEAAEDPTNALLEFARNRVRHQVLPALLQVNSRAVEHLAEFARVQREDHEALGAAADEWLDEHPAVRTDADTLELDRMALRLLSPAVMARVLMVASAPLGLRLSSGHLRSISRALERTGAHVDLSGGSATITGRLLQLRRAAALPAARPQRAPVRETPVRGTSCRG